MMPLPEERVTDAPLGVSCRAIKTLQLKAARGDSADLRDAWRPPGSASLACYGTVTPHTNVEDINSMRGGVTCCPYPAGLSVGLAT